MGPGGPRGLLYTVLCAIDCAAFYIMYCTIICIMYTVYCLLNTVLVYLYIPTDLLYNKNNNRTGD